MDNLTHSLAGWTLGQTGLKRKTRKGLAALILGANAPDIDVFLGWVPWAPLATHRGFTHSLAGGVWILPPLTAALLWLLDRWQVRRGGQFKSELDMHFGWLVALAYIGCLTHPLLDWQTNYAIQLFTPFDLHWYHNDALFIIDVWIWAGLGMAIWLSRRREARGGAWQWPAIVGAAGVVAYISANGVLSAMAHEAPRVETPYANPDVTVVAPPPILFWRREVIWRQDHHITRGQAGLATLSLRRGTVSEPIPDGMTDPLARKILLETPSLASFRRWSILPMAWVRRGRCEIRVEYQDARFGVRPGEGRLGTSATVPTGAADC